jgi:NADP-dependent 3-hydroxy acid dehydrogenase YdfG
VAETLRKELFTEPVRVTEIEPGIVETDFSLVRFDGDEERAAKVYEGVDALTAEDIAECVAFVATRPGRVNIDQMVVLARDQLGATQLNRRPT